MSKGNKILISVVSALFLMVVIINLLSWYFLGVVVTTKGGSHGFDIGEDKKTAYIKAKELLDNGNITAMHVDKDINQDNNWNLIVNPEWWNNKISLKFEEGRLVEITRTRICCELP